MPVGCWVAHQQGNPVHSAGRTTDRGVSLPTQDVMVSSLPQRCQDEIKEALELVRSAGRLPLTQPSQPQAASRVSRELPGVTRVFLASTWASVTRRLEFTMSRAFVIVYDAKRQKGLKKHTVTRNQLDVPHPSAAGRSQGGCHAPLAHFQAPARLRRRRNALLSG